MTVAEDLDLLSEDCLNKIQDLRCDLFRFPFKRQTVVVVSEVRMGKTTDMNNEFVSKITNCKVTYFGVLCRDGDKIFAFGIEIDNKKIARKRLCEPFQ